MQTQMKRLHMQAESLLMFEFPCVAISWNVKHYSRRPDGDTVYGNVCTVCEGYYRHEVSSKLRNGLEDFTETDCRIGPSDQSKAVPTQHNLY